MTLNKSKSTGNNQSFYSLLSSLSSNAIRSWPGTWLPFSLAAATAPQVAAATPWVGWGEIFQAGMKHVSHVNHIPSRKLTDLSGEKKNHRLKSTLGWDMLVPWRVFDECTATLFKSFFTMSKTIIKSPYYTMNLSSESIEVRYFKIDNRKKHRGGSTWDILNFHMAQQ